MRPSNANEGRALDTNMYMTNSFNGSALQMTAEAGVSKLLETYICSVELHRTKVELGCWRKRRCSMQVGVCRERMRTYRKPWKEMRRAKTRILDKGKGQQDRDQTGKVNFASIGGVETSEAIHHESRGRYMVAERGAAAPRSTNLFCKRSWRGRSCMSRHDRPREDG